jgi:hypothetical protein
MTSNAVRISQMTAANGYLWSVPKIVGPAGPEELADAWLDWRRFVKRQPDSVFPPLNEPRYPSSAVVRQLVSLSFHASLAEEEGRYSCLRIYVPCKGASVEPDRLVTFDPALKIKEVEDLRRLAPAASSLDFALSVVAKRSQLLCDGIVSVATRGVAPGFPGLYRDNSPPGLLLRIDRPGEVRVSDPRIALLLKRGRVAAAFPLVMVTPVAERLLRAAAPLYALTEKAHKKQSRNFGGGVRGIGGVLYQLLATILAEAVHARTGGAFVILPDSDSQIVSCKYRLEPFSWGDPVVEFWSACVDLAESRTVAKTRMLTQQWNSSAQKLLMQAKAIATLSKTDGCVYLDQSLGVIGFGGKIDLEKLDSTQSLAHVDPLTKRPVSDAAIRKLGMRHQSAFKLCRAIPNAMAFVVSQDGDVRVFYSDFEHVYFLEGVYVSTANHPVW